eukprot:scaffold128367_cov31-Tisochrysis_lutea.AAC.3
MPATAPAANEKVPESEVSATSGKAAKSAAEARSKGTSLHTLAGRASKRAIGPPRANTALNVSNDDLPLRTELTRTASNGHSAQATKAVAITVAMPSKGTENRSELPGPAAPRTRRPKSSTRPKDNDPARA